MLMTIRCLLLLMALAIPTRTIAETLTLMWADTKANGWYARSTTTDGYVMNHKYSATVKMRSPIATKTATTAGVIGSASATVFMAISPQNLGEWFGEGEHSIDCPYNVYDQFLRTVATGGKKKAGISVNCYKFRPGTCQLSGSSLYGSYDRIDLTYPYPKCYLLCLGPSSFSAVKQSAGLNYCQAKKVYYRYWYLDGTIYKCTSEANTSGAWWGTGSCSACEEKITSCMSCL